MRRRKQALVVGLAAALIAGCAPGSTAVEPTTANTADAITTTDAATTTDVITSTDPVTTTDAITSTDPVTTTDTVVKVPDLPPPDLPENLHYVFQRQVPTDIESGDRGEPEWEIALGLPDGQVVPLLRSDGDWSYAQPMVSPDGRYLAVTGWKAAAEDYEMAIFVAPMSDLQNFRRVEAATSQFACPAWTPDGQSMLVTREVASDDWRVSAIDIRTGAVSDVLDASFGADDYPCGVLVDDETFVYHVMNAATGDVEVRRWNLETSDDEPVLEIADCNTVYPIPRPDTDQVAVISRCRDDGLDGLRMVSLADDSVDRVLNGLVGAPTWSPDGNWILFAYAIDPLPTAEQQADLWIARADGSQATRLQDASVAWPAWLPAEFDCPDCPGS